MSETIGGTDFDYVLPAKWRVRLWESSSPEWKRAVVDMSLRDIDTSSEEWDQLGIISIPTEVADDFARRLNGTDEPQSTQQAWDMRSLELTVEKLREVLGQ